MYAKVGEDNALWGTIFEKTFAKYLGQYEAIEAGGGSHGIEAMNGSPSTSFIHLDLIQEDRGDEIWDAMLLEYSKNSMITAGSYTGTGSD